MPESCGGCGSKIFDITHPLCFKTGGLLTKLHNELRYLVGDLCECACGNGVKEPTISGGTDG